MPTIDIHNKKIGDNYPCFIIAEAGVNHNGDLNLAKKMIAVAKKSGADAIKFQTFHADKVVIKTADKAEYQKATTGTEESQYDMIKKLELTDNEFSHLANYSRKKKILFLSTPFDKNSVDVLDEIGVPAFKISSGEITNFPLLTHIAKKSKPVILSTGMSTMDEVAGAVDLLKRNGAPQIAILHCVTSYPAEIQDLNLRVMDTLKNQFNLPVGFSDHSMGIIASIAAVAMGASIIEKHFTLKKTLPGPDHKASLNPKELLSLVNGIRQIEAARGTGIKILTPCEQAIKKVARRSIVSAKTIRAGELIQDTMLEIKRPGTGIDPTCYNNLLNRKARVTIPKDTIIVWNMIE